MMEPSRPSPEPCPTRRNVQSLGLRAAQLDQLVRFALVSGVGLVLDVLVFTVLIDLKVTPFVANALGASLAVTWVYFFSARRIFRYDGNALRSRFAFYAMYQAIGITAASWMIGDLINVVGLPPMLAKIAVVPFTVIANYLFMAWLTTASSTDAKSKQPGQPDKVTSGPAGLRKQMSAAQPRILVFVPMYQCERQIARVLARIDAQLSTRIHEVLVIDNGSHDRSREVATAALASLRVPGTLLHNTSNFNLGGSHKVAFAYAKAGDFDWLAVVHGDDQAEPADLLPLLDAGSHLSDEDALLGSRFSSGSRRIGYAWHRTCGNLVFNFLFTLIMRRRIEDLGSGLNLYRVAWLRRNDWSNLADDLTFNIHLLLLLAHRRARFRYFPITWREEGQVSNVRLLHQASRTLAIAWGYFWRSGIYLAESHARCAADAYIANVESENELKRLVAGPARPAT